MIPWLVMMLAVGYLMSSSVLADQAEKNASGETAEAEDASLIESLANSKSPFVSLVPKIEPVTQAPVPVPIPSKPQPLLVAPAMPTLSSEDQEKTFSNLKVNGIVWGGERPQAIINDQVVSLGETVQEAKVVAISEQGVGLQYKGRKITLTVDR
ncbi:MAG: hypothetical protein HY209_06340 [Candidatus Omnitrophica bacterium]|nr:hypothetical protein [Candidatus Omnitrophota bacterium]